MTRKKTAAAVAALIALPFILAACTSAESTTSTPSDSATVVDDMAMDDMAMDDMAVGADPATWTPVMLTAMDNGKQIDMVVGQHATISGLPADDATNNIVITTDNPAVIEMMEGDGITTMPGFHGIAPGSATVLVMNGYEADMGNALPIMQFTVTITEAPAQ